MSVLTSLIYLTTAAATPAHPVRSGPCQQHPTKATVTAHSVRSSACKPPCGSISLSTATAECGSRTRGRGGVGWTPPPRSAGDEASNGAVYGSLALAEVTLPDVHGQVCLLCGCLKVACLSNVSVIE